MKRYIKSTVITEYPTLTSWLKEHASTYDFIALVLGNKHVVINDQPDLVYSDLKHFLNIPEWSWFGDCLVIDADADSIAGIPYYTLHIEKPN